MVFFCVTVAKFTSQTPKNRHQKMAFRERNWAQTGPSKSASSSRFPCFCRTVTQKSVWTPLTAAPETGFYDVKLAFCMAPHGPVFSLPLPSHLKRILPKLVHHLCVRANRDTTTEQSTAHQKWNSLSTIHSEAMSAKLNAKCQKACSSVHLFLPKPKNMYKLGKSCGVK